MELSLISSDGLEFILRWFHFMAGITWVGLLYYYNFVQGPFMGQAEAVTKTDITTKMAPNSLWWFRWSAMGTVIAGLIIYFMKMSRFGGVEAFYSSSYGVSITIGGVLGLIMWFNVWFIIWPNQKVMIATTTEAAAKGAAPEGLAGRARIAFLASRTNTMLSIPMLFFMAAASHMAWF